MKRLLLISSIFIIIIFVPITKDLIGECNHYTIRWVAAVNLTEQTTSPLLGFDGDRLYGCADKYRFCLNKNTSQLYWSVENLNYYMFKVQPVTYKDKVIYNSSVIQIVDSKYGSLLGKIDIRCGSNPVLINNYYFVLSTDGVLYKIDLETLKVTGQWVRQVRADKMFIRGENVYLIQKNKPYLGCYSLDGTQNKWTCELEDSNEYRSLLIGDFIYVSTEKNIYCISINDGKVAWKIKNNNRSLNISFSDNKVYVGLMCIDAGSGRILWEYGNNICESVICQNKLFAFYENNVTVHDLSSGQIEWVESKPNPPFRYPGYFVVPSVCEDKIYVPIEGFVICYGSGINKVECKLCSNSIRIDGDEVFSNIPAVIDKKDGNVYVDAYKILSELGCRLWSRDNTLIYCTKQNHYIGTIYLGDSSKKYDIKGKLLRSKIIEGTVLVNIVDLTDLTGATYTFDISRNAYIIINDCNNENN